MKIAVIGTGYVGLTTGTCFAEMGNEVICMDIDAQKVQDLQNGLIPIYEPGLEELVKRNIKERRLKFSTDSKEAVEFGEIVFSAVGTPPDKDEKTDLRFVKEVARQFGQHINSYKVFVNKSTVPVGTGALCKKIIQEELDKRETKLEFDAVSNPEFLREGNAIEDTMKPDRVVIGHESDRAKQAMSKLYKVISDKGVEILFTDLKTAEIIKYASNSFLATKISFINEIANFCELAGGDIHTIAKGIGLDKRIGKQFLRAGIGYGGSCFPKDVKALIQTGKEFSHDFQIIKAVDAVNENQKELLYHKLREALGPLQNKTIGIWGLAFKPGTDDMREAPSLTIIQKLLADNAKIQAFDPVANQAAQKLIESTAIKYCDTSYEAASAVDALLILTEWDEFRSIDFSKLKTLMTGHLLLDGRNIIQKTEVESYGFQYICVGLPSKKFFAKNPIFV